ncbi:MAG TPA: universal stress protein [Bauldia sp.]|nr:universal stress protein [Bauldia sp.]
MATKRRSGEAGHRRKFLVIIDDTPECARAVRYAARRAEHTGGSIVLLYVITPADPQSWAGVENIMRAEAMETAETSLGKYSDLVRAASSIEPEPVIREGLRSDEIVRLIEADQDIAILVLAAGTEKEGPGPLVTAIAGKASGTFPVPITIVPGNLDDEALAAIS